MGAGIAAAGWDIVNWSSVASIAMSWVISPLMGGIIAAGPPPDPQAAGLLPRRSAGTGRENRPVMIGVMGWAFTTYVALKGIKKIVAVSFPTAMVAGIVAGICVYILVRPLIVRARPRLTANRDGVNRLFTIPLIFAAALLSFAHGANDVANAVGPLAGVVDVLSAGEGGGKVAIPLWVMAIGALGISIGLALFGPKLIRTVGSEITELDRARAFCIALSAAITVIIASQLGMPISSTHVALGAVFGVGFLREWLDQRIGKVAEAVLARHEGEPDFTEVEAVLMDFRNAPIEEKRRILKELKDMGPEAVITAAQRKELQRALKRQLVSRTSLLKIASAWVITLRSRPSWRRFSTSSCAACFCHDGEPPMKKYYLPVAIGALIIAFWLKPEVQEIAAGVAIFLFGMLMLEDGFKLFGGGILERMLARATRSTPRSILFGIVSTTLLQSSSLVSVITISFLSAGLISLIGGVGIVFGANIGTTTGAWLVAGLGLKVNIAAYAMPMIAISIVLVFQKSKLLRGIGFALGGLGFLFLGIHHMKEGFEAFRDQIDLSRFALPGLVGLVVYTLIGMAATVIMQSSHATMVLIITALAAGQITYDNALALAIGANIGTTITAIIGALGANFQGKRLALAHLIFNVLTAAVALVFISPLREAVDWVSANVGIGADDFALKLAVFHTIFNVLGVALVVPFLRSLVAFLERRIVEPEPDVSRPHYLNEAVDEFPQTLESALRQEVMHLYENAVELILHGLNLHRHEIYAAEVIADTVRKSRKPIDLDIDEAYEHRIKTLYSAIVDYSTRAGDRRISTGNRRSDLRAP